LKNVSPKNADWGELTAELKVPGKEEADEEAVDPLW